MAWCDVKPSAKHATAAAVAATASQAIVKTRTNQTIHHTVNECEVSLAFGKEVHLNCSIMCCTYWQTGICSQRTHAHMNEKEEKKRDARTHIPHKDTNKK